MKKFFKYVFFAIIACGTLTACDTDDEDGVAGTGKPANPEKEIAGVYSGTWTQVKNDVESTGAGTLTIEAGEQAYSANITAASPSSAFNFTYSSIANVTPAYVFYNNFPTNGFGASFNGAVKDGTATITFQSKVKEGRKWVVATFIFSGTKSE